MERLWRIPDHGWRVAWVTRVTRRLRHHPSDRSFGVGLAATSSRRSFSVRARFSRHARRRRTPLWASSSGSWAGASTSSLAAPRRTTWLRSRAERGRLATAASGQGTTAGGGLGGPERFRRASNRGWPRNGVKSGSTPRKTIDASRSSAPSSRRASPASISPRAPRTAARWHGRHEGGRGQSVQGRELAREPRPVRPARAAPRRAWARMTGPPDESSTARARAVLTRGRPLQEDVRETQAPVAHEALRPQLDRSAGEAQRLLVLAFDLVEEAAKRRREARRGDRSRARARGSVAPPAWSPASARKSALHRWTPATCGPRATARSRESREPRQSQSRKSRA